MDLCAANIGIGEPGEAAKQLKMRRRRRGEGEEMLCPVLAWPASLSRAQTRSEGAQSSIAQLAMLPQSPTTILLVLLEFSANDNLTTHFLAAAFNTQTPKIST
jgi:hypothetical protein